MCAGVAQPARRVHRERRQQWERGRRQQRVRPRRAHDGAALGARAVPHAAHPPRRQGGPRAAAGLQGLARVRPAPAHYAQPAAPTHAPQGRCARSVRTTSGPASVI